MRAHSKVLLLDSSFSCVFLVAQLLAYHQCSLEVLCENSQQVSLLQNYRQSLGESLRPIDQHSLEAQPMHYDCILDLNEKHSLESVY